MPNASAKAVLLCLAIAAPALVRAQAHAAPSFQDLESGFSHAARIEQPQAMLRASLPAGTPVTVAEARLQTAGATCRAERHAPGVVKCLYHQYDLSDGAADDIRWTVALHTVSNQVADFSVNRYVDRHGTN